MKGSFSCFFGYIFMVSGLIFASSALSEVELTDVDSLAAAGPKTIWFLTNLHLKNVTEMELNLSAESALCGAVTTTMGLPDDRCQVLEPVSLERRRLLEGNNFTAVVKITAKTTDFEETSSDKVAAPLYTKLITSLSTAVNSTGLDFTQTLRAKAVIFNASSLFDVDVDEKVVYGKKPPYTIVKEAVPTQTPVFMPTKLPTMQPKPLFYTHTVISFDVVLDLSGVASDTLTEVEQTAVCVAVTRTMNITDEKCAFVSQVTAPELRRRLATSDIDVTVKVTASTQDFTGLENDVDGSNLYKKLTLSMEEAIGLVTFTQTLRDVAVELNADALENVNDVNLDSFSQYTVVPTNTDSNNDSVSDGEYAGIIISALFILLVALVMVWYCVYGGTLLNGSGHDNAVTKSDPAGAAPEQQRTSVAVTYDQVHDNKV